MSNRVVFVNVKKNCNSIINDPRLSKVIILGDVNVGKTSVVNRFCRQSFNFNYKATIGVDFEIQHFKILKTPFNIQIWDTAGQERFRCIAAAYYRSAHVVVTVFDFTNINSLRNSLDWLNEATNANSSLPPLKFLVGTKKDLVTDSVYTKIEEIAIKMAKSVEAEYWAVSSKTGDGVKGLFFRIAALSFERIIKQEMEMPLIKCKTLILTQKNDIGKKGCKIGDKKCYIK
ncbi:GTP-binding nuclear protein RAN1, putative [Pediculus humanus corporis]|uniref:Ras-related protein Rab-36 n=1 Tax=Pediculus humanus subsp. corporis TaxID=121224 RepID=E0VCY7_PEDHC|nr:GTP-binding nuclear protein RAN1, putative [Pediculus humanus corporis]EEB11243.1 GTP-binding nuclear protein RAN1, putative [Pediculus humanus corporis]